MNLTKLDRTYQKFISNLQNWIPEGIIEVNENLLKETGLQSCEEGEEHEQLPYYFHVIETHDKISLFNHQFIVWIVPKIVDNSPTTIVMIALIIDKTPHLEVVFSAQGAYNTPQFVLKLLKHYLSEVADTEEVISSIKNIP